MYITVISHITHNILHFLYSLYLIQHFNSSLILIVVKSPSFVNFPMLLKISSLRECNELRSAVLLLLITNISFCDGLQVPLPRLPMSFLFQKNIVTTCIKLNASAIFKTLDSHCYLFFIYGICTA